MEPVTLTTERLLLRPFEPADAPAVHAACQDPAIPLWTSVPAPFEMTQAHDYIARSRREWHTDSQYRFAVTTKTDGTLTGAVSLFGMALQAKERQAEIGYWAAKEQRGKGWTSEAVREVARWAFTGLGVERLEWLAEVGNAGSRGVALKAGFRMEGTLRAKIAHRGVRRDAWVGSLLPADLGLASETPHLPFAG
ncbi:acetyltransferase [Streptomyces sp. CB02923]|uniref:GNAT family N-acetyltransferase n=1 Tax=Streptomyces sp. CB02923 TaxID=1718985 RepID=UPI00093EF98F|nr:GNAT family N-acetyltransferase [Streptomyces sp. CB02923]OKI06099.1 acetyltransferase [Streptomyces sp. CB02923]